LGGFLQKNGRKESPGKKREKKFENDPMGMNLIKGQAIVAPMTMPTSRFRKESSNQVGREPVGGEPM